MNALTCHLPAPEHRAGHFTLLGFCMIASNSAGPMLVGLLFDSVSYRIGFGILAGLTAVAVAGSALLLHEPRPRVEG